MIAIQSPAEINKKISLKRKSSESTGPCGGVGGGNSNTTTTYAKKPCYRGTIYEAMLSPLPSAVTLPVHTRVCQPSAKRVDATLQSRLTGLTGGQLQAADEAELRAFLVKHSDRIDINQYGEDGVTPLQRVCQSGGDVAVVRTLIGYGADARLTSRDGWSAVHMATFSGNTSLMMYLLTQAS